MYFGVSIMSYRIYFEVKKQREYMTVNAAANQLDKYGAYDDTGDDEAARKALIDFFQVLLKVKPSEEYDGGSNKNYYAYIPKLLMLRNLLESGKYANYVWEMSSFLVREPVLQPRIYYNLIAMYEKNLI